MKTTTLILVTSALAACAQATPDDLAKDDAPGETEPVSELSQALTSLADRATTFVNARDPQFTAAPSGPGGQAASGMCLDVSSSGGHLQIHPCHGGSNQQFVFDWDSETIVGVASGWCLDVQNSNPADGATVQMWPCNGGNNQRWRYTGAGGLRSVATQKCLDIVGYGTTSGSRVQMWSCHSGNNQTWSRGSTILRSAASSRCLDVEYVNGQASTRAQIWDCHGNANQRWNRLFNLNAVSDVNGLCLKTRNNARSNGTPVDVTSCLGDGATFTLRSDGSLYHLPSGRCLDVLNGNVSNGASLQLYDCHGGPNQTWTTR